ncbi:quinone-dependent dihydroorotate dehydrogenase [Pontixanthobacter aestiaquae]|uniref:Dihydroorotate dehydrogenase (quinone) n=1 Tax=Pontixanthobacter aestiaquae TaxID=1509367 RepID=A0A844Z2K2_9SPHN|nr:quinone-dependent dihydroorotate dehydrogenase [Pontixanthobacter aestiaquae]MDN3646853.1 quinone-dependent dihydroorotate dehydrogenase [Pontixanthobacter aestiaquae]MXO82165.1 quinone-dependent dihydroorotate dehydrogenase [Pontixanthobacter aestiaquae]
MIFKLLKPAIFTLDPERAHQLSIAGLRMAPAGTPPKAGKLATHVAGIRFPNPVGVAAGYDKDAEVPDAMLGLGFGFTEVGSITPRPQEGNPKPRLFRLVEDKAVINRMGFNNGGAAVAKRRLTARKGKSGIVGINIGANKDSIDRIADYAEMTRIMAPLATYLAVNISSPNTPGLRALQDEGALIELLDAVFEAREPKGPPVFLKVAPDLTAADIDSIARIAKDKGLGALIVSNTTISRPASLQSRHIGETGGLSGAPLKSLALERLRDFRKATGAGVPLIGVGGIGNAEDAWERIRAGASLVQLYSAMVYEGPGLPKTITRGLERLMKRDGFSTIAEAVGSE